MKKFAQFTDDADTSVKKPKCAKQRHKIKEQLGKFDKNSRDNWENVDYDSDFQRFEKFTSRK